MELVDTEVVVYVGEFNKAIPLGSSCMLLVTEISGHFCICGELGEPQRWGNGTMMMGQLSVVSVIHYSPLVIFIH